jgi:hypothetical protein
MKNILSSPLLEDKNGRLNSRRILINKYEEDEGKGPSSFQNEFCDNW